MKKTFPKQLFLIVRGRKSEHHKAPFHPVILCSRRHTAKWEAGETQDGSTVYECMAQPYGNWLLVNYKGYDINYGHVTKHILLFDGKETREVSSPETIDDLLNGAIWWSYDNIPDWIKEKGVVYATDDFTKGIIAEDSGMCLLPQSQMEKLQNKLDDLIQPEWLRKTGC